MENEFVAISKNDARVWFDIGAARKDVVLLCRDGVRVKAVTKKELENGYMVLSKKALEEGWKEASMKEAAGSPYAQTSEWWSRASSTDRLVLLRELADEGNFDAVTDRMSARLAQEDVMYVVSGGAEAGYAEADDIEYREGAMEILAHVSHCKAEDKRDSKDVWCVYSHDWEKLLGRYQYKEDADQRLKEVEYFKSQGKRKAQLIEKVASSELDIALENYQRLEEEIANRKKELDALKEWGSEFGTQLQSVFETLDVLGKVVKETDNYLVKINNWEQPKNISFKEMYEFALSKVNAQTLNVLKQQEDLARDLAGMTKRTTIEITEKNGSLGLRAGVLKDVWDWISESLQSLWQSFIQRMGQMFNRHADALEANLNEIKEIVDNYPGATVSKKIEMGRRHRAADINDDLLKAVFDVDLEKVRELLDQGANPNAKDKNGDIILMIAARNGYTGIIKLLLDAGADPNAKDENGWTALMEAAYYGHTDMVKLLLDAGADVNAKDENGYTALMWASRYGHTDVVELLKQHGATANKKIERRHRIAGINDDLTVAARYGDFQKVKELLNAGADPNAEAIDGWTVLMVAVEYGWVDIVELLLDKGANPNVKDRHGWTALMVAALKGYTGIVKLLLDAGADPDVKNEDGKTALMWAASYGYTEIVGLLKQYGATASKKKFSEVRVLDKNGDQLEIGDVVVVPSGYDVSGETGKVVDIMDGGGGGLLVEVEIEGRKEPFSSGQLVKVAGEESFDTLPMGEIAEWLDGFDGNEIAAESFYNAGIELDNAVAWFDYGYAAEEAKEMIEAEFLSPEAVELFSDEEEEFNIES